MKEKLIAIALVLLLFLSAVFYLDKLTTVRTPKLFAAGESAIQNISEVKALNNGKWIRSFRAADGAIYLRKHLKTTDGGLTFQPQSLVDVEEVNAVPESAVFAKTAPKKSRFMCRKVPPRSLRRAFGTASTFIALFWKCPTARG
ncbi:MAG: hypothetical protein IPM75_12770 [Candidatus Competibacteraceae bacterium]|nr:hypothetical protein [Candidatus Competibacteraceae bacterium]